MEKVNLLGKMVIFMMENGLMIKKMDLEIIKQKMSCIKETLLKIKWKVSVSLNLIMETYIKDHGKIIYKMVKVD